MKRQFVVPLLLLVFVCAAWAGWPILMPKPTPANGDLLQRQGMYGDSFGALNALFTGFALVGLVTTILLQVFDSRARDLTRGEDQFESRFFRLNDSLRSVVSNMVIREENRDVFGNTLGVHVTGTGKDVFSFFVYEFENNHLLVPPSDRSVESQQKAYEKLYNSRKNWLGPYFRMLYHIVRYADRASIKNKEEFTDIVRAELSGSELHLLALNCLSDPGRKFKPLAERYHLLKHLSKNQRNLLGSAFDPSAFED